MTRKDWVMKCYTCEKETTMGEIEEAGGCSNCGGVSFNVVRKPEGEELKPDEPPRSEG